MAALGRQVRARTDRQERMQESSSARSATSVRLLWQLKDSISEASASH